MGEELPAHLIDDILAHLLEQELHPVRTDKQGDEHPHILGRRHQHALEPLRHCLAGGVVPSYVQVNRIPGEHRLVQLQGRNHQHQR